MKKPKNHRLPTWAVPEPEETSVEALLGDCEQVTRRLEAFEREGVWVALDAAARRQAGSLVKQTADAVLKLAESLSTEEVK
ncbi:MAG: hypothetical protein NT062_10760 [Proteobacteria bacterium]|nr:hypothetical protein [Pseudomonadota bacterium]